MPDKPEKLDYSNPQLEPRPPRGGIALRPMYCFLLAVTSLVAAIALDLATGSSNAGLSIQAGKIAVILPGIFASVTGIVAGVRQHDKAEGPVVNQAIGCLFGLLSLWTTLLLTGMLIYPCVRMFCQI